MQHLYLSYPPDDYALAHRLVDDLQAAGYAVFIDAVSETASLAWSNETRRAIRASGAVLMILSPGWPRRPGIRHEGVLARRGHKPVYVLLRAPGALPRYLNGAHVIDCMGPYEPARDALLRALPVAQQLQAETLPLRRRRRMIQRQQARRRWTRWAVGAALAAILLIAAAAALGLIPM